MISQQTMNLYGFDSKTNTFQQPIVKWKNNVYYQRFSVLKKNGMIFNNMPTCYFHAQPLKIQRNELITNPSNIVNRTSIRINKLFEQPGSIILNNSTNQTQQNTFINVKNVHNSINSNEQKRTTPNNALTRVRNRNMFNNNASVVNKKFTNNNNSTCSLTNYIQPYTPHYTPTTNINSIVPPSSDYLQYYTTLQPTTPPTATNLSNITIAGRTETNLLLVKPNLMNCCE